MSALLCIQSSYGTPGNILREATKRPDAAVIRQTDLNADHIAAARGLVTTMHLDQLGMMGFAGALERFLDRGGRWFFNGHVMRPLVAGLGTYQPIRGAGRDGLRLTVLNDHPVFAGVDRDALGARKGVAGFYGRGYNPLPDGALAVTGVGPDRMPLDWDWARPGGGRIFSHAGNDMPGAAEQDAVAARLAQNAIAWTVGEEEGSQ